MTTASFSKLACLRLASLRRVSANWRAPDSLTLEMTSRTRASLPFVSSGSGMSVSVQFESEEGEPPPGGLDPVFSGPLTASYVAEWHTGVIEELVEFSPDWAGYVVINDQSPEMAALREPMVETRRAIVASSREVEMEAPIKAFAQGALAHDAGMAANIGAAFSVTLLFEPLLAGVGAVPEPSGRTALEYLCFDVGNLPWEAVAEYRDHAGSEEARGKLRDLEERAIAADPEDPLEFQRDVAREITQELFAVIADLESSLTKDLADEAVKTGVSFIPVIGPFLGPGTSAQAVADEVQGRRTWYAALIKLATPSTE